jgi:hypothetical protein
MSSGSRRWCSPLFYPPSTPQAQRRPFSDASGAGPRNHGGDRCKTRSLSAAQQPARSQRARSEPPNNRSLAPAQKPFVTIWQARVRNRRNLSRRQQCDSKQQPPNTGVSSRRHLNFPDVSPAGAVEGGCHDQSRRIDEQGCISPDVESILAKRIASRLPRSSRSNWRGGLFGPVIQKQVGGPMANNLR